MGVPDNGSICITVKVEDGLPGAGGQDADQGRGEDFREARGMTEWSINWSIFIGTMLLNEHELLNDCLIQRVANY